MKTQLYAVRRNGRWLWNISVDIRMDRKYWFQESNGRAALWLLEPFLSFGQARVWGEALARACPEGKTLQQSRLVAVMKKTGGGLGFPEEKYGLLQFTKLPVRDGGEEIDDPLREEEYAELCRAIGGRSLLVEELMQLAEARDLADVRARLASYLQWGILKQDLHWLHGIRPARPAVRRFGFRNKAASSCMRCGSNKLHRTSCPWCGGLCPYCEECLGMGRVRFCSPLVGAADERKPLEPDEPAAAAPPRLERWGLSDAQAEAVRTGLEYMTAPPDSGSGEKAERKRFLIWAVTGAGKTEMLFPFIEREVSRGGRVLIASPRRDVVLELQPRLAAAFPEVSLVTLHGASEQRWENGDITLSTNHQLLRFGPAFDLVVVDEVDAFPYHNNPMLEYAANKVVKPGGAVIWLTATPPPKLQRMVRSGRIAHVRVPARFHRHPLPVPTLVRIPAIADLLKRPILPGPLTAAIGRSLERGAQIFLFVPMIRWVEPMVELLRRKYPDVTTEGTSSKDPLRGEKVRQFRARTIRILVTTTILERGVTIPKSDVLILDADSPLFDEGALVQMAGRAGRSKDDPAGRVVFYAADRTRAQTRAVRQIRDMNRYARRKGFLD